MAAMSLQFDFLSPQRINFGWGRRRDIGRLAGELGRRAFIVSGSRRLNDDGILRQLQADLRSAGVEPLPLAEIHREPQVEDVDRSAAALTKRGIGPGDFVLAIGGGSAIDLGKAVAAMATNADGDSVREFLEGVGSGRTIDHPPLPMLAMPTTGGTGSEATKNAVISSHDPPFKKSLRSERMIPRVSVVDPELAVSVPPQLTGQTGMDAITQLIESFISRRAQPIPRALALDGLTRALPAILEAVRNGSSQPAREAMAQAALLSGLALANSGLGLAHGVAAALGIVCDVPHGLACAVMLPAALETNRQVSESDLAVLEKVVSTGGRGRANDAQLADAFIHRIKSICRQIGIPDRLSAIGVRLDQIPAIVAQSRGNSMSGNPRDVPDDELTALLQSML